MRSFPDKLLLPLALIFTLLNAAKPLTIDDTAYHDLAAHLAQAPLDPYGYAAYWWSQPMVGNEVLAPPLLPYWCALSIRLFGKNVFLMKMGLLPFSVLFAYALYALSRRFARGLELPLVTLTLFSPTFLPSLNLMLDVPALAIALTALVLFMRACDRDSFLLAALAGVVAGLGMETKYTVFLAPAAMLLYAACLGRLRLWPIAAFLAAQVFLSWELLMSLLYGESHFLLAVRDGGGNGGQVLPLISNLGSVAWPVSVLALAALGVRWRGLLAAGAIGLFAYAAVAGFQGTLHENLFLFEKPRSISLAQFVFGGLGFAGLVIGLAVVVRLIGRRAVLERWRDRAAAALSWKEAASVPRPYRVLGFLLLWLCLEVIGFKVLSPWAAVRRIMGVVVVSTLLVGHLSALTCRATASRRAVWAITALSALLGLLVYRVDLAEARAEKEAVEESLRRIRAVDQDGIVWYIGHWGFQYYANRAGMHAISAYDPPARSPIPLPPRSAFKEGDWLVLPPFYSDHLVGTVHTQDFQPDEQMTEYFDTVTITDHVPLQTIINLYSGSTAVEYHEGDRLQVEVRRVVKAHAAKP